MLTTMARMTLVPLLTVSVSCGIVDKGSKNPSAGVEAPPPVEASKDNTNPEAPEAPKTNVPFDEEKTALVNDITSKLADSGMSASDIEIVKSDMLAAGSTLSLADISFDSVIAVMTNAAIKALKKISSVQASSPQKKKFSNIIATGSSQFFATRSKDVGVLVAGIELLSTAIGSGVAEISTPAELEDLLSNVSSSTSTAFIAGAKQNGLTPGKEFLQASVSGITAGAMDGGVAIAAIAGLSIKISEGVIKSGLESGTIDKTSSDNLGQAAEAILVQVIAKVQKKAIATGKSAEAATAVVNVKQGILTGFYNAAKASGVEAEKINTAVTKVETSPEVTKVVTEVVTQSNSNLKSMSLTIDEASLVRITRGGDLYFSVTVVDQEGAPEGNKSEASNEVPMSESGDSYFSLSSQEDTPAHLEVMQNINITGRSIGATSLSAWVTTGASCSFAPSYSKTLAGKLDLRTLQQGSYSFCIQTRTQDAISPVVRVPLVIDRTPPSDATVSGVPGTIVYQSEWEASIDGPDVAGYLFKFIPRVGEETCANTQWEEGQQVVRKTTKLRYHAGSGSYWNSGKLAVDHNEALCVRPVDVAGNIGPVVATNWEKRLGLTFESDAQISARVVVNAPTVPAMIGAQAAKAIKFGNTLHVVFKDGNGYLKYFTLNDQAHASSVETITEESTDGFAIDTDGTNIVVATTSGTDVSLRKPGVGWSKAVIASTGDDQVWKGALAIKIMTTATIVVWAQNDESGTSFHTATSSDHLNFSTTSFSLEDSNVMFGEITLIESNGVPTLIIKSQQKTTVQRWSMEQNNWNSETSISNLIKQAYMTWQSENTVQNNDCQASSESCPESSESSQDYEWEVHFLQAVGDDIYISAVGYLFKAEMSSNLSVASSYQYLDLNGQLDESENISRWIEGVVADGSAVKLLTTDHNQETEQKSFSVHTQRQDASWEAMQVVNDIGDFQIMSGAGHLDLLYQDTSAQKTWRLARSSDFGVQWNTLNPQSFDVVGKQVGYNSVTNMVKKGDIILALSSSHVSRSMDGGLTWQSAQFNGASYIGVSDGNFIMADANGWVARSADGTHWRSRYVMGEPDDSNQPKCDIGGPMLTMATLGQTVLLPYNPGSGCQQMSASPLQGLKSSDGGMTWSQMSFDDIVPPWQNAAGVVSLRIIADDSKFYHVRETRDDQHHYTITVSTSTDLVTESSPVSLSAGGIRSLAVHSGDLYLLVYGNLYSFSDSTFSTPLDLGTVGQDTAALLVTAAGARVLHKDEGVMKLLSTDAGLSAVASHITLDDYDVAEYGVFGISSLGNDIFTYWGSRYGLGAKIHKLP